MFCVVTLLAPPVFLLINNPFVFTHSSRPSVCNRTNQAIFATMESSHSATGPFTLPTCPSFACYGDLADILKEEYLDLFCNAEFLVGWLDSIGAFLRPSSLLPSKLLLLLNDVCRVSGPQRSDDGRS